MDMKKILTAFVISFCTSVTVTVVMHILDKKLRKD